MCSYVLDFLHFEGSHTGPQIAMAYNNAVTSYAGNLNKKTSAVVTDTAANMKKAYSVTLPGFSIANADDEAETEETDLLNLDNVDIAEDVILDAALMKSIKQAANILNDIIGNDFMATPENLGCFLHILQLVVKDALALKEIEAVLLKAAMFIRYARTSTILHPLITSDTGKQMIVGTEVRWNSQIKALIRFLEINPNYIDQGLVKDKMSRFTKVELKLLQQLCAVLEPFEEATDHLQFDKKATISMCKMAKFRMEQWLAEKMVDPEFQCVKTVIDTLQTSLRTRLAHIETDKTYLAAAILDPAYRGHWIREADQLKACRDAVIELLDESIDDQQVELPKSPPRKATRMSFMPQLSSSSVQRAASTMQIVSGEQQLNNFLKGKPVQEEPIQYWSKSQAEFPTLYKVALKILIIPCSSCPVKKVFSQAGLIMSPHRSSMTPKTLSELVFLKVNASLLPYGPKE